MIKVERLFSEDGVELVGLLYESGKFDTAVVHIHGWCGNFYENEFVQVVGNFLSENGVSFLAINTRAHDYKCDLRIKTREGFSSATGGGAVDDFSSSVLDIDAAVKFLKKLGYKRVIVQGHSTAAQKALNYALKKGQKDLILLSAGDINSEIVFGNSNSEVAFKEAYKLIRQGRGDEYMKNALWGLNFTANALVKGYGAGEDCDLFPIRTGNPNVKLEKVSSNILNILGEDDQLLAIYSNAKEACEFFKKSFPNANQKVVLLKDNHSFQKNPLRLAKEILKWINKN